MYSSLFDNFNNLDSSTVLNSDVKDSLIYFLLSKNKVSEFFKSFNSKTLSDIIVSYGISKNIYYSTLKELFNVIPITFYNNSLGEICSFLVISKEGKFYYGNRLNPMFLKDKFLLLASFEESAYKSVPLSEIRFLVY